MKRDFMHSNFALLCPTAERLYHEYAAAMPIIDYHSHLSPRDIAQNRAFANLYEAWLEGDHYKWRAMRSNGVAERFCTGDAPPWEKFQKWAETVPYTLRNPLYHWTHLELRFPFGLTGKLLSPATAKEIWDACNEKLARPEFTTRGLLRQFRVTVQCTTDDPAQGLKWHKACASDAAFPIRILPTFRPDACFAVDAPDRLNPWLDSLGAAANVDVRTYDTLLAALRRRMEAFHAAGCRLADHGLERPYGEGFRASTVTATFAKARAGRRVLPREADEFKSAVLFELGRMYAEKGWTMQLHFGPIRNNNSRMFRALGPDTGFDSIGDAEMARPLARMLDRLDRDGKLPKTILYNINPKDNETFATMIGNFQDGSIPGKIQYGSAWWFLDQRDGMEKQLDALSNLGLLSRFVGMLTDSRSFLSFSRHDYFRRVLCNKLGQEMEQGLMPDDFGMVGAMIRDICYNNAARYFGFEGVSPQT